MRFLISMDDTDNLETHGTGWLVEDACMRMTSKGWGEFSMISRHQLYVHPDIPFTSHNSAMVFWADVAVGQRELVDFLGDYLERESAPGSDPGLCVAPELDAVFQERLIAFGRSAKDTVLTKAQAYALAAELGIHLSEHGGTGGGVIGALAGVGLRLWGNDGRFRGWFHFAKHGTEMDAGELCRFDAVDEVRTLGGELLAADQRVIVGERIKTVCMGGKSVLLVLPHGECMYETVSKDEIRKY